METTRPFTSTGDLAQRANLHRDELARLAEIGACASLGLERRAALWQVSSVQRGLLAGAVSETPSPLAEMTPFEQTLADYRGTGITTGPHLVSHLRPELRRRGVRSASELRDLPDGQWVRTAGVVIVRQRPATAKGFLFMTLEDETGTSNSIVLPDLFERQRALLQTAGLLLVEGPLQNQEGVIHVRVRRLESLDHAARAELPRSHDFR